MLEGLSHAASCFVTLTYAGEPFELKPKDLQDWLKRLRFRIAPQKIRYFAVGEYGDTTFRPHYHAALFGYPSCFSPVKFVKGVSRECDCPSCSGIRESWGHGFITNGRLERKSAAYIAGYVTKKMTHRDDPRLQGRHPEFARMSTHPGLGREMMWEVASTLLRNNQIDTLADVPFALNYDGKKQLPLGRYLRRELRKMVGRDEKTPPETLDELKKKLQIVRDFAWQESRSVRSVFEEINGPYEERLVAQEANRERKI